MKCNMCDTGDMTHEHILYDKEEMQIEDPKITRRKYEEIVQSTLAGEPLHEGKRIVHIYNCTDCPNSQLEYYQPDDAIAYMLAMCGQRPRFKL